MKSDIKVRKIKIIPINLNDLEAKANGIDIDMLETGPVDLKNLVILWKEILLENSV